LVAITSGRGCHGSVLQIRSDLVRRPWTDSGLGRELLVELRRDAGVALHRQIETAIRDAVRSGRLRLGSALPPTRALADELGVSRGVVVEAYQQLIAEGYLTSRPGGYTRTAVGPEAARRPPRSPSGSASRGSPGRARSICR
jgi:GntR family transcriptional regulator/MocR family aminotransferase